MSNFLNIPLHIHTANVVVDKAFILDGEFRPQLGDEKINAAWDEFLVEMAKNPILMTADHQDGAKMEELVAQLFKEFVVKHSKISDMDSPEWQAVARNNVEIMRCLLHIHELQTQSMQITTSIRAAESE